MSLPPTASPHDAQQRARLRDIESMRDDGAAAVPRLLAELAEPSWAVRRAAVAVLAAGDRAVALLLCRALKAERDNEAQISGIVDALSASRADIDQTLVELTRDANPAVVCDAAQILGRRESTLGLPVLEALTRHANDNVALAAVEALGRIGGKSAVDSLLELIASRNFFRTFPAIDVLGRSRDPRALPALVKLAEEPLYAAEAVRAIGRVADLAAVGPLVRLLETANEGLVRNLALALVAISEQCKRRFGTSAAVERALAVSDRKPALRERLTQSIKRADPLELLALGQVLGWIGDESTVPALLALLDEGGTVAQTAAVALKQLVSLAEPQLLEALRRGPSARRRLLIPIVGGRSEARQVLVECLDDEDSDVRALACDALAEVSDTSVVPAIFPLLTDADGRVAQAALGALQSLGSTTTKELALQAATSGAERLRCAALRIIGYFAYPEGLELLAGALRDPGERVRDAAIAGLPLYEDPRAVPLLIEAARHSVIRTRTSALRALGQTPGGDARVLAELRGALTDESPWVRYYACQALGKQRDDDAAALLAARLADESGQVRVAAVEALAHLTAPSAFEALNAAVGSEDADLHRAALVALGISKRAEALPQLLAAVASEEAATRLVALSALSELGLSEGVPALARAVEDRDEGVATAATGFLGARVDAAATNELITLLRKAPHREPLVEALSRPAPGRIEAISDALASADDATAGALVGSLARMSSPDSLQAIRATLSSRNDAARRASASALVALQDRESSLALEQAALKDPDAEVRRICAAVLNA